MAAEEFVIRMIDGAYYAGGAVAQSNLSWSYKAKRAHRFPTRMAALMMCSQGIIFARATILTAAEAQRLEKPNGEPTDGMQGQQ